MPRARHHVPLRVLLNNRLVGHLLKESGGAISFRYDESWLARDQGIPISLSIPLREDAYKGATVSAFFDNLLPDSDRLIKLISGKVGADGTDSFSLLTKIGRDCVGALQFVPADDETFDDTAAIKGKSVGNGEIEKILNNLTLSPLGMDQNKDFRISIAGAQEKTAFLFYEGQWLQPEGTTPTTHIFKKQLGHLPNGLDLSDSVENEFYCLRLMGAFGLPVNAVEIRTFGKTKSLVIERFDRKWTKDGRLLRVPQEDCCQALSVSPGKKYQNDGGPGMVDILKLLSGSDTAAEDQKKFLKAQILFWLIGATDGHAKNFSLFLGPGGSFQMTPLYDVLTAQPSLDAHHLRKQDMKLAMSAGINRHYRVDMIQGRHFIQTAKLAKLPERLVTEALEEVIRDQEKAFTSVLKQLPRKFPLALHESVMKGFLARMQKI